jgi:hypothetical protein
MTKCDKPAEKPGKGINESLGFLLTKSNGKNLKDNYAHSVVPALFCWPGSPSPLFQFGPMANLQVPTCAAPGPPGDPRTGADGGKKS